MDNNCGMKSRIYKRKEGKLSLNKFERETIISWDDSDNGFIWIYSSQISMIRKLKNNPLFVLNGERFNEDFNRHPNPVSIEGYLPLSALRIYSKISKAHHLKEFVVSKRDEKGRILEVHS